MHRGQDLVEVRVLSLDPNPRSRILCASKGAVDLNYEGDKVPPEQCPPFAASYLNNGISNPERSYQEERDFVPV